MADNKPNRQRKGFNNAYKPGSWNKAMQSAKGKQCRRDLKGRLMYNEWMFDIPEDFAQKWIVIGAPVSKRVIIVLNKNTCQLYNKYGQLFNSFTIPHHISTEVVLDGFVCHTLVYILDFIQCGPFELESCDFGCRRLMGINFLEENHILTGKNTPESWKFKLLEPSKDCSKETLERCMNEPTSYILDGWMFYHKEGIYISGVSPLVGWLKPEHIPGLFKHLYGEESGK